VVKSRIYAQIETQPEIYQIAEIEYDGSEFSTATTLPDGIAYVTESILELLQEIYQVAGEMRLNGATGGERSDGDTSTGHIQQQL
jgi:hypothetical protein